MADYSKFGVPLDGNKLGMLQPKFQYRFRVVFKNIGYSSDSRVLTQNIISAERPKVEFATVEQNAYNSKAYFAGRHTWQPITIRLYDDMSNGVVSLIGQQVQKQMNHREQTSATAGANYKFTCEIHTLDGTNNDEIERWVCDGCWILNYTTPDSEYTSNEGMNEVSIQLQYDTATQLVGPNDLGGNVRSGDPMPNTPSPGDSISIG
ncbi:MAG: hypothetical protein CMN60_20395 [Sphingobium sp.]|nr:hypothetical protein [Sphingobium sp.]|tara:strand:- start:1034 stop:1651 length:618 start_codon:yes stop_codon:yes gene_type:complete